MSAYTSSFVPIFDWVQWGWRKSNQCDNGAHYAQTSSVSALLRWCPKNRGRADLNDTCICVAGTRGFTFNINCHHIVTPFFVYSIERHKRMKKSGHKTYLDNQPVTLIFRVFRLSGSFPALRVRDGLNFAQIIIITTTIIIIRFCFYCCCYYYCY